MPYKKLTNSLIVAGVAVFAITAAVRFIEHRSHTPQPRTVVTAHLDSSAKTIIKRLRLAPDPLPIAAPSIDSARSTAPIETPPPPADLAPSSSAKPPAPPDQVAGNSMPSPVRNNQAKGAQPSAAKKDVPEPIARAALSFVGVDKEAEAVWASTINDANVDPNTRKDLIEDLNEDGFPDPEHLSRDDLPLILERIRLIEQHAPFAMDDVNAAAFQEAYKDLVKMAQQAAHP